MLHDVVQRKKFYTLVLQKCLTRSDVCESYEAVYNMLAELDKAYEAYKETNKSILSIIMCKHSSRVEEC